MTEEEKKAIDKMKSLLLYSKEHEYFSPFQEQEIIDMDIVLNIVEKLQKEIEEKSTIIIAGTEKVKQLEKEIILLKIEKLRAMKQYKECHLSQMPDTSNIYYSIKLELEAIDEEISNLMRIWWEKY